MTDRPYAALTLEQVAKFPRPGMAAPVKWGFTPDGRAVTYLFSEGAGLVLSLWQYDIESARRTELAGPTSAPASEGELSRDEALRRERLRLRELGVTDYHFASNAEVSVILVPSAPGVLVKAGAGDFQRIPGTENAIDPRLSPDGRMVAFVRAGELFVVDTAGGPARQLTTGATDGLTHGLAEFIAQEELDRLEGFWWSPDGSRIAFEQADSRHIPSFSIVHDEAARQDVEAHRYPFAGHPNAVVRLGVVALSTGEITWADLGPDQDQYLARVSWRPSGTLVVEVLSRDQQTLRLLSIDPSTGRSWQLLEEHREPWVNLTHDLRLLESGEFVRSSEKTGFSHLYLHASDGTEIRALTGGEWTVTGVLAVDESGRRAFFQGTRDSVLERHVYCVSLDGGDAVRLTREPGWHSATFAKDASRFVDVFSSPETAPVAVLCLADGSPEATLFDNGGLSAKMLGLEPPEYVTVRARDGTLLHGALYAPSRRDPERKCPAIVSVYGGPHAQRAVKDWAATAGDLRAQYLAQHGYVVFKLDNRGSANRGLAFEAHIAGAMGTVEVDDQVAGVRFLESLGYVDIGRVGIFGWSYGGYITCLALMKAPDVFKAGVAGAPVTDWDGYDTGYTERYMGTPATNPGGYREGSVLTHVAGLRGRLLLVHGLVDENVHFRHTVRLVAALAEAGKDYDLVVFPGERHMPRGQRGLEYVERRLVEHFDRYL